MIKSKKLLRKEKINQRCEDCGKLVNPHFRWCRSCCKKGKRNPYWGIKGEKHCSWNPNLKPEDRNPRNTEENRIWRKKVFELDNYTCCFCGVYGGKLNAHHINKFSKYKDLRFNIQNGITLCEQCHKKVEKVKRVAFKEYPSEPIVLLRDIDGVMAWKKISQFTRLGKTSI